MDYGVTLPNSIHEELSRAYEEYSRLASGYDTRVENAARHLAGLFHAGREVRLSWAEMAAACGVENDTSLRPMIKRWHDPQDRPSARKPDTVLDKLGKAYQRYTAANEAHQQRRETKAHYLAALVSAGRDSNWPWPLLAEPCGITGERLRQIVKRWHQPDIFGEPDLPDFPDFDSLVDDVRSRLRPTRPRAAKGVITDEERAELRTLSPLAKQNKGSLSLDSSTRSASERFSDLIIRLRERNVSWEEISLATGGPGRRSRSKREQSRKDKGHTIVGLRMRAARHGLGSVPPTIKAYQRETIHPPRDDAPPPPRHTPEVGSTQRHAPHPQDCPTVA